MIAPDDVVFAFGFVAIVAFALGHWSGRYCGYDEGHDDGHTEGYEEAEKEAAEDRAQAEEVYQAAERLLDGLGKFAERNARNWNDLTTLAATLKGVIPEPEVDDPNMDDDK